MDNKDLTPTYIGKKPCGCVVFAMVDEPNPDPYYRKELAKEIAKCIRQGLTIEKMPVEDVRKLKSFGCKCDKPEKVKETKPASQEVMELKYDQ